MANAVLITEIPHINVSKKLLVPNDTKINAITSIINITDHARRGRFFSNIPRMFATPQPIQIRHVNDNRKPVASGSDDLNRSTRQTPKAAHTAIKQPNMPCRTPAIIEAQGIASSR